MASWDSLTNTWDEATYPWDNVAVSVFVTGVQLAILIGNVRFAGWSPVGPEVSNNWTAVDGGGQVWTSIGTTSKNWIEGVVIE